MAAEDNSIDSQNVKGFSLKDEAFLPQVEVLEEDRPLALSSVEGVIQKGTVTRAKMPEVVSAKKTAKSQKDEAEPMGLQKISTTLHPGAIAARPTSGSVVQNQAMGQVVMPTVADRAIARVIYTANTSNGGFGDDTSVARKSSTSGTIAAKDSWLQKDVAGGNTLEIDVEVAAFS